MCDEETSTCVINKSVLDFFEVSFLVRLLIEAHVGRTKSLVSILHPRLYLMGSVKPARPVRGAGLERFGDLGVKKCCRLFEYCFAAGTGLLLRRATAAHFLLFCSVFGEPHPLSQFSSINQASPLLALTTCKGKKSH